MIKTLLFSFTIISIATPSFAQWNTLGNNTIHTNSGNVGIGTTNPQTALEVNGHTYSNSFRMLGIGDNVNGSPWYGLGISNIGLNGGAASNVVQLSGFAGLNFKTAAGQLVMNSDGYVGIGTTKPSILFHVVAPISKTNNSAPSTANIASFLSTSDANAPFGLRTMLFGGNETKDRYVTLQTTDLMTLDGGNIILQPAAGSVGIGVNDPNERLVVNGNIKAILSQNLPAKNVAALTALGVSGITGAQNWAIRGVYQHGNGVSLNADGGDLDIIKSFNGNTILATKTDGSPLGNVSIGTNAPRAVLDVARPLNLGETGSVFARLDEGNTAGSGTFLGVKGYATQVNSSNTPGNVKSFALEHAFYGHTNSSINFFRGGNELGGYLTFATNDNTEQVRILANGNVAIGTTDAHGYKLAVAGSTIAESVTVKLQTAWPDYVFKPTYRLQPLANVKAYIDANHHLPDMPSEKDIAKEGLNLGEIVKVQTKKIEELTLYLIEQNRQIIKQQKELNALKRKAFKN
jgi:hypothetical protein